jgi:HPt (histidine-containing phosphotransfer) domain-containing protein
MTSTAVRVTVAKDLEDLIPTFMSNRRKELEALRAALASADFEQVRLLGHRMRGVGHSYGYAQVSEIGKHLEDGARGGDGAAIGASIAQYAEYLERVEIVYE